MRVYQLEAEGVWPQGGALAHQCFGDTVLLSYVAEISGAAGLEPDVIPELSVVLSTGTTVYNVSSSVRDALCCSKYQLNIWIHH